VAAPCKHKVEDKNREDKKGENKVEEPKERDKKGLSVRVEALVSVVFPLETIGTPLVSGGNATRD
jgi:hypothetical protein